MLFRIPHDHPALAGHFPGRPVVPGVVVVEQVVAAIEARHVGALRLRLPQVKFLAPLLPGEEARVELAGDDGRWRFTVTRGATTIAIGELAVHAA